MNLFLRLSSILLFIVAISSSSCQSYYQASKTENLSRPINPEIDTKGSSTANEVASIIDPYQEKLVAKMEEVIAQNPITMEKAQPESRLGNWVAGLTYIAGKEAFPNLDIAFAVQNYGGIRVKALAAGPVTVGEIYELMPFDNELVAVELNGFVLQEFIDHMAADGGWPISEQLRFRIEADKAVDVSIQGEPIAFNRNYIIVLPDYVANGGSDSKMLIDRQQYPSGQLIRDLLIDYTRKIEGPIKVKLDGRISKG